MAHASPSQLSEPPAWPLRPRLLLLHPDPAAHEALRVPPGWELIGMTVADRAPAASVEDAALTLVHRDLLRSADAQDRPAVLIDDAGGRPPAGFLTSIRSDQLSSDLLTALLSQCLARWRAERALTDAVARADFHRWHDAGTQLPSSELLREHAHRLLGRARRLGVELALIQLDLLGQLRGPVGSERLREVAAGLAEAVGGTNPIGRGESCAIEVLISDLPGGQLGDRRLAALLDRIGAAIARRWPGAGGRVRMGVARGGRDDDLLGMARAASAARAEAWRSGRSWVDARSLSLHDPGRDLDRLLAQLVEQQLTSVVQPVVRLEDGAAVGAELLLRARTQDARLEPPACALHLLHDHELLRSVGRLVRDQAVARLRSAPGCPRLAVNLAPSELEPQLAAEVLRLPTSLRRRLVLELTEGALDGRPGQAEVLAALAGGGVALSVDDFGTGHAALERLRGGWFGQLKLDRRFVMEIQSSAVDRAIAGNVLDLGHRLGLSVVAEGVETPRQRAVLRRLGYRLAQGYLYARPMPWPLFQARYLAPLALPSPPSAPDEPQRAPEDADLGSTIL